MPNKKLSIQTALQHSVAEIERTLNTEVFGAERIVKIYSSNTNGFILKTISPRNQATNYILKFSREGHIQNELEGQKLIEPYLHAPKLILISKRKFFGLEWALYEFVQGKLMTEKFLEAEKNKSKQKYFFEREKEKESLLKKLHSVVKEDFSFNEYLKSKTNQLFYKRLIGARYKTYYGQTKNSLSSYFDHRIELNGKLLPRSINEIVNGIIDKFQNPRTDNVKALLGHGDAHHGNIILNKNIWFIDSEYAGFMPPYMELAKPYYNDFIGTLFFHYHEILDKYFRISKFNQTKTRLVFRIETPIKMNMYLKVTRIKLNSRQSDINKTTKDFLSLNDYLILCHMLTKNPNTYSKNAQLLFVLFIPLLASFDPLDPESIYRYF